MEQTIVQLIGNLGFPIVVAGVMFKYIQEQNKRQDEAEKRHDEREKDWQKALENNTLVVHELLHEIKAKRGDN